MLLVYSLGALVGGRFRLALGLRNGQCSSRVLRYCWLQCRLLSRLRILVLVLPCSCAHLIRHTCSSRLLSAILHVRLRGNKKVSMIVQQPAPAASKSGRAL